MWSKWSKIDALGDSGGSAPRQSGFGRPKHFWLLWGGSTIGVVAMLYFLNLTPWGVSELIGVLTAPGGSTEEAAITTPGSTIPAAALATPEIIVSRLSINAPIIEPKSSDFNVLNSALAKGVVHYPGSAVPGEVGNVFLFGHSSGLKVIHNKAYAVFNRLREVESGEIIRIRYAGREYWYRVGRTYVKDADDARIDLSSASGKKMLTLSTCKLFGGEDERFIVEAEFVRSYPLRT